MNIKKGDVKTIFPFFLIKSKIFGNRLISLPFLDFGGVRGEFDKKFILEVLNEIKEKFKGDSRYLEIRLNSFSPDYKKIEKILLEEGFKKELKGYQFILKLKKEEELWEGFDRLARKGIKKAKKSDLRIKEMDSEKELRIFYDLYIKNMRNFGTPQHSYEYFANLLKKFKENFRGLNCYKNEKLIGSLIVLYSEDYMYAAYNFSEHNSLIYQPNDLLYWKMITWAIKNNIKYFDFGQCEPNVEKGTHAYGIYKFKRKWTGDLYERPYFKYSFGCVGDKENSSEKDKYKKMIGLWKTLPLPIIKKLGPKIASQLAL